MSTEPQARNCAELAVLLGLHELPKSRTMASACAEIRAFYEEHGRRPAKRNSRAMRNLDAWLRLRDSSLSQLCYELGLPGGRVLDRTMDSVRKEVTKFHEENGRRPHHQGKPSLAGGSHVASCP